MVVTITPTRTKRRSRRRTKTGTKRRTRTRTRTRSRTRTKRKTMTRRRRKRRMMKKTRSKRTRIKMRIKLSHKNQPYKIKNQYLVVGFHEALPSQTFGQVGGQEPVLHQRGKAASIVRIEQSFKPLPGFICIHDPCSLRGSKLTHFVNLKYRYK